MSSCHEGVARDRHCVVARDRQLRFQLGREHLPRDMRYLETGHCYGEIDDNMNVIAHIMNRRSAPAHYHQVAAPYMFGILPGGCGPCEVADSLLVPFAEEFAPETTPPNLNSVISGGNIKWRARSKID
eukprot:gene10695-biopygen3025